MPDGLMGDKVRTYRGLPYYGPLSAYIVVVALWSPLSLQYAFMCLPTAAFMDGEINYDNCGIGRLFQVRVSLSPLVGGCIGLATLISIMSHAIQLDSSLSRDRSVQGIVIYSPRAKSSAAWLQSMELCFIKVGERRESISPWPVLILSYPYTG